MPVETRKKKQSVPATWKHEVGVGRCLLLTSSLQRDCVGWQRELNEEEDEQ
jgi:hypothetical protein